MQRDVTHNYFSLSSRILIIIFNQLAKPGGNLKPSPELLSGLSPLIMRRNHFLSIQFIHTANIHTCTLCMHTFINLIVTKQNIL